MVQRYRRGFTAGYFFASNIFAEQGAPKFGINRMSIVKLTGKVVPGTRQAAFFTQLDWVMEQCAEKLGFEPFPGTLNLEVIAEDLKLMHELKHKKGVELLPTDPQFCAATVLPIYIGGHDGAVVVPAEEVNIHKENIVEIMSGERLRDALNVEDGDLVTIMFKTPEAE